MPCLFRRLRLALPSLTYQRGQRLLCKQFSTQVDNDCANACSQFGLKGLA